MSHLEMNLEELVYLRNLLLETTDEDHRQSIEFCIEDLEEIIKRSV